MTYQKQTVIQMGTTGPSSANFEPLISDNLWSMFTSSAVVFRTRQAVSDLAETIGDIGSSAVERMCSNNEAFQTLSALLANGQWRFNLPEHQSAYSDVLLAAALPEEDFPAFILATCALLSDRLLGGDGSDNLYWNWDAFQDHYRLADAPERAALMNAFRLADEQEIISIRNVPTERDCLTYSLAEVLREEQSDLEMQEMLQQEMSAVEAGEFWLNDTDKAAPDHAKACRYLYERPASMHPAHPDLAPLIPWTPASPRSQ